MYRIGPILVVLSIYFLSVFPNHADAKALGYWMFDDKNKLGKDSSGFDNHGEPKKAAAFDVKGQVGGALKLDGVSWLEVPHDDSLNAKDQITLMCWVNFDAGALGESSEVSLIYKNGPFILEGDQKDRRFWTSYSLAKLRPRKKLGSFIFEAQMTEGRVFTAPGDKDHPEMNEWYHIAATANGSKVRLYTNGVEKAVADQRGEFKPSEQVLTIGFDLRIPPDRGGSKPYHFGLLDEVIILDKAITQDQVKEAMELGEKGKSLEDFQLLFDVAPQDKLAVKWGELKARNK